MKLKAIAVAQEIPRSIGDRGRRFLLVRQVPQEDFDGTVLDSFADPVEVP